MQRNKDKDASKHLGHNANHKKCGETSLKHWKKNCQQKQNTFQKLSWNRLSEIWNWNSAFGCVKDYTAQLLPAENSHKNLGLIQKELPKDTK